jgi:hypothetical protein
MIVPEPRPAQSVRTSGEGGLDHPGGEGRRMGGRVGVGHELDAGGKYMPEGRGGDRTLPEEPTARRLSRIS